MMRRLLIILASVVVIHSAIELPCEPPCEHGACMADHGHLSCHCDENWFGMNCSVFICERQEGVCGSGICVHHPDNASEYLCACPPGVLGNNCEHIAHADSCSNQMCSGHGHCYGAAAHGGSVCVCSDGFFGPDCQYGGSDPCSHRDRDFCHGHGNCSYDDEGRGICTCEKEYVRHTNCRDLTPLFNPCDGANPCLPGDCISTAPNRYRCDCPLNYTGVNCSLPFEACNDSSCVNGGQCSSIAEGHYFECSCPAGFSGWRCEIAESCDPSTQHCPPDSCSNGGTLTANSSSCLCPVGFTGETCETRDFCADSPCSPHTLQPHCLSHATGYVCVCEQGWGGSTCHDNAAGVLTCLEESSCPSKSGNAVCDEECNSRQCGYDGWDCVPVPPEDPWGECPLREKCRQMFLNGVCDEECNTEACLFDGWECVSVGQCVEEAECKELTRDGQCQPHCYTATCPYDGQDCSQNENDFAENQLVLILFSEPDRPFTYPWREQFLKNLSRLINSIPVIEKVTLLSWQDLQSYDVQPPPSADWLIYRVELRLDVSQCVESCPEDAQDAVSWIQAAIGSGHPDIGPYVVQSAFTQPDEGPGVDTNTVVFGAVGAGVLLVILAVLVVGVLLGKRRRVTAKIWRPHSPSDSSPSTDTAAAARTLPAQTLSVDSKDYIEEGNRNGKMLSNREDIKWENSTVPLQSSAEASKVVVGQRGSDKRHFDHRKRSPLSLDSAGPGGFTPLMLSVIRRPGALSTFNYQSRSSSESSSDDQTALIPSHHTPRHMLPPGDGTLSAFLETKTNLDAVNDYQQTALYLAAAHSRPEYVDQLLEAGANPNIQDNWGQSPLHAAIGAGAEGAFMVLLNCSRTKYNLKSDGGVTPLMSAVKMVNGFMVKQLLKKDSEIISSTDEEGRTAVHWAAMVDNIEALRMLVKCGSETIKDAQDNKGQTPLFLACREGSVMCVKHLIDCFANVTLLDNLEQSPMQIAMQKQYVDIVELLRASSHGPLYMRPHSAFMADVAAYSTPGHTPLVTPPTSKKRKPKSVSSSSGAGGARVNKYLTSQASYPSPTTSQQQQLPGDGIAMTELHLQQASSSSGNTSYVHSPPTTYPHNISSHSPPLPPHCQQQPTSTHGHYSAATPTTSGYSEATPTPYDELPPPAKAHCSVSSLQNRVESYGLYPSNVEAGTRPLQHLPVVTEAGMQTCYNGNGNVPITPDSQFVQTPGGVYSPPQSGGSMSQQSPHSAQHSSPGNSTVGYGASPQSATPSPPESQHQHQQTIAAVGTVHGTLHVESGSYNYPAHILHPQHFMGSTPV